MRHHAGRLSADMIAGRPQYEQAAELRSFAVLNLAWSSVVKLLMVLATAPNQNVVAKGTPLYSYATRIYSSMAEMRTLGQQCLLYIKWHGLVFFLQQPILCCVSQVSMLHGCCSC